VSACAVGCSSFYFAKRWHFVCLFTVRLLSVVSSFRVAGNGWRYGKCGIKLLLICLPAQMYVKISNVSTNTQTRICY